MKKILIGLVFICVAGIAGAQKVAWGIKAGANITNFTGGNFDNVDKKALIGFHGGIFVGFRFGAVTLQPEVYVSSAGAKFENADSSFKLVYLSVPVMLKYRTAGGFYVEAGPQFSFKISDDIENQSIHNFVNDMDLSAGFGLGCQTKGGLGIGARYLLGISKVGDFDVSEGNGINPDFKNSVLQVGLSLALGK